MRKHPDTPPPPGSRPPPPPTPPKAWRCYWCDAVFTDRAKAEIHFGAPHSGRPMPECGRLSQRQRAEIIKECADRAQIFIIAKGDPCYDGKDVADALRAWGRTKR